MITTSAATQLRDAAASYVGTIRKRCEAFLEKRKTFEADTTHRADYIADRVKEARNFAFQDYAEPHKALCNAAKIAGEQRSFWADPLLVMDLRRFDKDPLTHATIALSRMTELGVMPAAYLQRIADVARAKDDIPLLYRCVLVGQKFSRDEFNVNLSAIVLPEQVEALAALDEIPRLQAAAEHAINQTAASLKHGSEQLAMARRMQPPPEDAQVGDGDAMDVNRHLATHGVDA